MSNSSYFVCLFSGILFAFCDFDMSWFVDESLVPHYMRIHTDKLSFVLWFQGSDPHAEQNIDCTGWLQRQGPPVSCWNASLPKNLSCGIIILSNPGATRGSRTPEQELSRLQVEVLGFDCALLLTWESFLRYPTQPSRTADRGFQVLLSIS